MRLALLVTWRPVGRRIGMNRKGVTYDVGTMYAGRINTCPVFDARAYSDCAPVAK
jgi:hypothetical protein